MSESQSALSGITVVDVSGGMAAALASMLLADNGARVIRVALRDEDVVRNRDIFAVYDRGKEVVRLDADDPGSKAALRDLRAGADVVVDDLAPSSSLRELLGLDRLGRLRDVGDALVHCSITAYGTRGPLRDGPADHDLSGNICSHMSASSSGGTISATDQMPTVVRGIDGKRRPDWAV